LKANSSVEESVDILEVVLKVMERVSRTSLIKMKDYIQGRNNATRLGMVELVAQYVMHDLEGVNEDEKEEALVLTKYHLSTDRGIEEIKALYPSAVAWAEEGLFRKGLETK
jgi:hypothetical protein